MNRNAQISKYLVADFLSASIAWLLFNVIRYDEVVIREGFGSLKSFLLSDRVLQGQVLIPLLWLILYYFSGYYNKPFGKSRLGEFFSTWLAVIIGTVFIFFVIVLNDLPHSFDIYYKLFFSLLFLQFFLAYIPRLIITRQGIINIRRRKWSRHVLLIGIGMKAGKTAEYLYKLGYTIAGFVKDNDDTDAAVDAGLILGSVDALPGIMASVRVDELVIAVEKPDTELTVLYSLYRYKRPIKVLADGSNMLAKVNLKTIQGIPLVDVSDNNFSPAEKNIKWFSDKLFSLLALILLSPLFIYIALRVKKDSKGPLFFKQERIGYMGKPFTIYKFRTMYTNAEDNGPLLSVENDPRVTPYGIIMRKYRLDELPQFWNVLKGDMSLVGPRPERKYYIDRIVRQAPYYYLLHNVRPGITSLGMVKYGYAADIDQMVERLKYDMIYYENMSLELDLMILVYTVRTVLTGKGV